MRVQLLVDRAMAMGIQSAGDRVDVPDADAIRMIEAGQAVAVRGAEPERAVKRGKVERS